MNENLSSFTIKSWNTDDRPREKLLIKGKGALSDAELIAILIGSGNRSESAVALSQRILASVSNDLNQLRRLNISQLSKFKGIGEAKAISIVAALELGKRINSAEVLVRRKIRSSKDAFNLMKPHIGELDHEEFWIVYLNNSNIVMQTLQLSKGGITGTLVDVRLVLKQALELNATAMILAHNHPSGSLIASEADKEITKKIKNAAEGMDIKLLDHLIVTEKSYFSFTDEGLL